MMNLFRIFALACAALSFAGCATHAHMGEATTDSPSTYLVSIGATEVSVGDSLDVFETRCSGRTRVYRGEVIRNCQREVLGKARVIEIISDSTARVQLDRQIALNERTRFEKIQN